MDLFPIVAPEECWIFTVNPQVRQLLIDLIIVSRPIVPEPAFSPANFEALALNITRLFVPIAILDTVKKIPWGAVATLSVVKAIATLQRYYEFCLQINSKTSPTDYWSHLLNFGPLTPTDLVKKCQLAKNVDPGLASEIALWQDVVVKIGLDFNSAGLAFAPMDRFREALVAPSPLIKKFSRCKGYVSRLLKSWERHGRPGIKVSGTFYENDIIGPEYVVQGIQTQELAGVISASDVDFAIARILACNGACPPRVSQKATPAPEAGARDVIPRIVMHVDLLSDSPDESLTQDTESQENIITPCVDSAYVGPQPAGNDLPSALTRGSSPPEISDYDAYEVSTPHIGTHSQAIALAGQAASTGPAAPTTTVAVESEAGIQHLQVMYDPDLIPVAAHNVNFTYNNEEVRSQEGGAQTRDVPRGGHNFVLWVPNGLYFPNPSINGGFVPIIVPPAWGPVQLSGQAGKPMHLRGPLQPSNVLFQFGPPIASNENHDTPLNYLERAHIGDASSAHNAAEPSEPDPKRPLPEPVDADLSHCVPAVSGEALRPHSPSCPQSPSTPDSLEHPNPAIPLEKAPSPTQSPISARAYLQTRFGIDPTQPLAFDPQTALREIERICQSSRDD